MAKSLSAILSSMLIFIITVLLSNCSSPEITTPSQPQIPTESELPSTITTIPTPELKIPEIALEDPTDDIFDKSGSPVSGEPFMDIVSAVLTTEGSDFFFTMKLKGPLPAKTPDSAFLYEWDIVVDGDSSPATGTSWPLVLNDLGCEYMVRLTLLDSSYHGEIFDLRVNKGVPVQYTATGDTVQLRWTNTESLPDTFSFMVATRKYGERGSGSAFMLADKAPNEGHSNFP